MRRTLITLCQLVVACAAFAPTAQAAAPERGFSVVRTEADGSVIVEIGRRCSIEAVMRGFGAIYQKTTGKTLTVEVLRAANPENTIPVCHVPGDGEIHRGRSENTWANCRDAQRSLWLIEGERIRVPTKPVETLTQKLDRLEKVDACWKSDTCLLSEIAKRNLVPPVMKTAPIAAAPVQATPVQPKTAAAKPKRPEPPVYVPLGLTLKEWSLLGYIILYFGTVIALLAWVALKQHRIKMLEKSHEAVLGENANERTKSSEALKEKEDIKRKSLVDLDAVKQQLTNSQRLHQDTERASVVVNEDLAAVKADLNAVKEDYSALKQDIVRCAELYQALAVFDQRAAELNALIKGTAEERTRLHDRVQELSAFSSPNMESHWEALHGLDRGREALEHERGLLVKESAATLEEFEILQEKLGGVAFTSKALRQEIMRARESANVILGEASATLAVVKQREDAVLAEEKVQQGIKERLRLAEERAEALSRSLIDSESAREQIIVRLDEVNSLNQQLHGEKASLTQNVGELADSESILRGECESQDRMLTQLRKDYEASQERIRSLEAKNEELMDGVTGKFSIPVGSGEETPMRPREDSDHTETTRVVPTPHGSKTEAWSRLLDAIVEFTADLKVDAVLPIRTEEFWKLYSLVQTPVALNFVEICSYDGKTLKQRTVERSEVPKNATRLKKLTVADFPWFVQTFEPPFNAVTGRTLAPAAPKISS